MVLTKERRNIELVVQNQFPSEPEIEYEQSRLEIPLMRDGVRVEQLVLPAILKMERGAPYINTHGHRQFEFKILEWEAATYCHTFGGHISFTLGKNPQPKSLCLSMQPETDYPAILVYNAIFDVYLDGFLVLPMQTGLGVGMNAMEIPPRIHVHFQKTLEFGQWEFAPGACVQMESMTRNALEQQSTDVQALRKITPKSLANAISKPGLVKAYFSR